MGTDLKNKYSYTVTLVLLSVISLLSGLYAVFSSYLGLITLPITSAFLSAIFIFEKKRRIATFSLPIFLCIAELISCIMGNVSLSAVFAVLIAVVIAVWYSKGYKKSESAAIVTLLITLLMLISAFFIIREISDVTTVNGALAWLKDAFNAFKEKTIEDVIELTASGEFNQAAINKEYLLEVFDLMYAAIPAYLVIFAFIFAGFTFKIFSALIIRYSANEDKITSWRFITSALFAYFYLALMIVSLFISSADGIFSLTVLNLEMIFMVVYAYIGYTFSMALISFRLKRPMFASLIFMVLVFTFSSLSLRILAVVGAIVTIMHGKILASGDSKPPFINN